MTRQPSGDAQHCARAWVEVDLDALRRNASRLAALAGIPLIPMVKADAYGLGAVRVARTLEPLGPWGFGVATVAEGEELRRAGLAARIVVFTPLLPPDLTRARDASLIPTLGSADAIAAWSGGGDWHLAIDTGMSRQGIRWERVAELRDLLHRRPPAGAFTHFHSADVDAGSRDEQETRFARALAALPARPPLVHAANSAAITHGTRERYDLARPGIFLYGGGTGPGAHLEPLPVVQLRAPIVEIRQISAGDPVSYGGSWRATSSRRIATLPVGYADGYRRALGNRATVLIGGRRAPVVGVVTMDMTMIDVTDVTCGPGDPATLIGTDGDEMITLDELASWAGTISYELLVGLRLRAERRYVGGT